MNAPTHSAFANTAEEAIAAQDALDDPMTSEKATEVAMQNTLLTPRFYTTDFAEMDAIDVSPVREDWDRLIAQMKSDPNKGHFKKNEDWDSVDWEGMDLGSELQGFATSRPLAIALTNLPLPKECHARRRTEFRPWRAALRPR